MLLPADGAKFGYGVMPQYPTGSTPRSYEEGLRRHAGDIALTVEGGYGLEWLRPPRANLCTHKAKRKTGLSGRAWCTVVARPAPFIGGL